MARDLVTKIQQDMEPAQAASAFLKFIGATPEGYMRLVRAGLVELMTKNRLFEIETENCDGVLWSILRPTPELISLLASLEGTRH